ncbi:hypothetical protein GWC95_18975 [Sediminibacterium roseum]|uniref:Secreted protein n=1 Tax=Sediminibacterium roseum TaxID=1978412 RepID=A0ABW9ZXW7_9BACT|nr:hypothetical protein [Sediminibacterium roseum]NCI52015.1 hypothetical protein [Sediminibacterium roseum]
MLFKQFLSAIVLLAICCQLFNRTAIVTSYYTNTAAYEKNCENKAKPQLACHGKCQMMKKLKAQEQKDQQNPERRSDNKNEVVLSSKSFYLSVDFIVAEHILLHSVYQPGKESKMPRSVFHPPSV